MWGSIQFIRDGGIPYSRSGGFRELWTLVTCRSCDAACEVFANVARCPTLYWGIGACCTSESDIYNCVEDVYAEVANKIRGGCEVCCPDCRITEEACGDMGPLGRSQFGNWALFAEMRDISAATPPTISPNGPPWDYQESDMCLEMDRALRATLVEGALPLATWGIFLRIRKNRPRIRARNNYSARAMGGPTPYTHSWGSTNRLRLAGNAPCPHPIRFFRMKASTHLRATLQ